MTQVEKANIIAKRLNATHNFTKENDWAGTLKLCNGIELHLRLSGGRQGKGYCSMLWPKEISKFNEEHIEIKFDEKKDAEKIANDIEKRLMPRALELQVIVTKRLKEHYDYENKVKSNIELLSNFVEKNSFGGEELRLKNVGKIYGKAMIYANSINLTLSSLSPEQALKIFEIIKEED